MSSKPAVGQALGVLATAFLASMAVSSFFFVKPGDAMADSGICQTQGILTDGSKDNEVVLTVSLNNNCNNIPEGVLRGIDEVGIAHLIEKTEIVKTADGYETISVLDLDLGFTSYTFEVGTYFNAQISLD